MEPIPQSGGEAGRCRVLGARSADEAGRLLGGRLVATEPLEPPGIEGIGELAQTGEQPREIGVRHEGGVPARTAGSSSSLLLILLLLVEVLGEMKPKDSSGSGCRPC